MKNNLKENSEKFLGLEIGRLLASLIVFLGHTIFQFMPWILPLSVVPPSLKVFSYGATAVAFFFILSGFVLQPSLISPALIKRNWIFSRIVRLFPVYLFCYIVPLILNSILNLAPTPNFSSVAISIFGFQSLFNSTYLLPPNPPLWSLSIELIFAFIFPFIPGGFRKKLLFLVLLILTLANVEFSPFLNYASYFLIGTYLRANVNYLRSTEAIYLLPAWVICIYFSEIGLGQGTILSEIWILFTSMLTVITLCILNFRFVPKIVFEYAKRTYSLYACHWPVLSIINYLIINNAINLSSGKYISICVISVIAITELIYRIIDFNSIKLSKRFR